MEAQCGRALLAAVGLLSALSAAGTLFLLAQWRELGAALRELEAAGMGIGNGNGSGSVRGPPPAPAPAARSRRSRRGERARGHVRADSDEMLLMLTYSMVPVRAGPLGPGNSRAGPAAAPRTRSGRSCRGCCAWSERPCPALLCCCGHSCWVPQTLQTGLSETPTSRSGFRGLRFLN